MNLLLIKHDTFFTLSYILALIYNTGLTTAFNSRLEAVTMCQNQERLDHGPNLKLSHVVTLVMFPSKKGKNKTKQNSATFIKREELFSFFQIMPKVMLAQL